MRGDGTDGSASPPEREFWTKKKILVISAVSWKMVSSRGHKGAGEDVHPGCLTCSSEAKDTVRKWRVQ